MSDNPIADPLCRLAPNALRSRRAYINRSGAQKLVVPCDGAANPAVWFLPPQQDLDPFSDGNEVAYFIDGPDTLAEIARAMKTATAPEHFIYLLGWWIDDGMSKQWNKSLLPHLVISPWMVSLPLFYFFGKTTVLNFPISAQGENLYSILTAAASQKVQIRAMVYEQRPPLGDMSPVVEHINDLPNKSGGAILDGRLLDFGSHHQKVIIVNGSEGLIAFCGGIDINPDRVNGPDPPLSPGSPLHDAHARIRGSSVQYLLKIFVERWSDHPYSAAIDSQKGRLLGAAMTTQPEENGRQYVQIVKTYGNATAHAEIAVKTNPLGAPTYAFAPNGLQTSRQLALHAIANARKFIYIEDQYFFDLVAAAAIASVISNLEHVTILLTWPGYLLPAMADRRNMCLDIIRTSGGDKLRVCFLEPEQGKHSYVHSKTTIVDDEFAIVGSTNYNRRSFTHDSEASAGVLDNNEEFDATFNFARRLRIRLWAEHLGMATAQGYAELSDGVAAAVHWVDPPPAAHIVCYDENNPIGAAHSALQAAGQLFTSNPLYEVFSTNEPYVAAWVEDQASGVNTLADFMAPQVWDRVIDPDGS